MTSTEIKRGDYVVTPLGSGTVTEIAISGFPEIGIGGWLFRVDVDEYSRITGQYPWFGFAEITLDLDRHLDECARTETEASS